MEDVEENNGMNCGKIKKACFIASSGGHWEELMCLREIADAYDTFFVTEEGGQAEDSNLKKIYTLPQINRHEKRFFFHFFKLFKSALKILKKEKNLQSVRRHEASCWYCAGYVERPGDTCHGRTDSRT